MHMVEDLILARQLSSVNSPLQLAGRCMNSVRFDRYRYLKPLLRDACLQLEVEVVEWILFVDLLQLTLELCCDGVVLSLRR